MPDHDHMLQTVKTAVDEFIKLTKCQLSADQPALALDIAGQLGPVIAEYRAVLPIGSTAGRQSIRSEASLSVSPAKWTHKNKGGCRPRGLRGF